MRPHPFRPGHESRAALEGHAPAVSLRRQDQNGTRKRSDMRKIGERALSSTPAGRLRQNRRSRSPSPECENLDSLCRTTWAQASRDIATPPVRAWPTGTPEARKSSPSSRQIEDAQPDPSSACSIHGRLKALSTVYDRRGIIDQTRPGHNPSHTLPPKDTAACQTTRSR